MTHYAWLVPALPLLASIFTALFGSRLGSKAHLPIVAGIGSAFLVSILVLLGFEHPEKFLLVDWIHVGSLHVPIEFRVDGLTTMMLSMVTFIATLVAIFASGYMAGDPGYTRFFAVVGLFVFSMTGLVLSNNYILAYGFWECVGACSYLLIGFWHEKPSAAAAAKKAFLVNRVGDLGFA
ncbi:MAG: proton-conducting transporter membrane subunit, partial [bacterium]